MLELSSSNLANYLLTFCKKKDWKLIGPAPGLIAKIGKKYRWQILIYGPEDSNPPLPEILLLFKQIPKNVHLSIDINPVEL